MYFKIRYVLQTLLELSLKQSNTKTWLERFWLVVAGPAILSRRNTVDPEQLEEDIGLLNDVSDLITRLNCSHSVSSLTFTKNFMYLLPASNVLILLAVYP